MMRPTMAMATTATWHGARSDGDDGDDGDDEDGDDDDDGDDGDMA